MKKLHTAVALRIHSGASTRWIMPDVAVALLPAAAAGVAVFGLRALRVILVCVISAVLAEALFNLACRKRQTVGDFSAAVTGLLLALSLNAAVPLWQCAIGSVFAVVVVKGLFGGIGKNLVNPANTAHVFMLLTFSAVAGGAFPTIVELSATATPLAILNEGVEAAAGAPSLLDLLLGVHGGAIGETCIIALLIGFVYLVIRRVIRWYVPAAFVATVFLCYLVCAGDAVYALQQILAGGLILGAVFMATDYVTTPANNPGRVVFCVGCGLITFAIRQFGSHPEGVSSSILVMNLLSPIVEKLTTPKTLGGVK